MGSDLLARWLRSSRGDDPSTLVSTVGAAVAETGGTLTALYLVDYEQRSLVPVPTTSGGRPAGVASIDGTMAGRAFLLDSPLATPRGNRWQVWVPVTERSNRLGVMELDLPTWDTPIRRSCEEIGLATALLVVAAERYTDLPHRLRRRAGMSVAAEMQWSLLPPLSLTLRGTSVAGLLEPAYEVGGDCFDYSVNGNRLDLGVFDATGHDLQSAVMASLVIGAYRNARRQDLDLRGTVGQIDLALRSQPFAWPYATALLARLDLVSGSLTWCSSGHPYPLQVRRGGVVPLTDAARGVPLGMGAMADPLGDLIEVQLEPGDGVLLYTDGVTDARSRRAGPFDAAQLSDLLAREHDSGRVPQEVLRRLVAARLAHEEGPLPDDASMVYVRWDGPAAGG